MNNKTIPYSQSITSTLIGLPMQKDSILLLVDDRPENLLALESILNEDHRKFLTATSGSEISTATDGARYLRLPFRRNEWYRRCSTIEKTTSNSSYSHHFSNRNFET